MVQKNNTKDDSTAKSVHSNHKDHGEFATHTTPGIKPVARFSFSKLIPVLALVVLAGSFIVWRSFAAISCPGKTSAERAKCSSAASTVDAGYTFALGRPADAGGKAYWSSYIANGGTITSLIQQLAATREGVCHNHPTTTGCPGAAGRSGGSGSAGGGSGSGGAPAAVMTTAAAQNIVKSLFAVVIGRNPTSGELAGYSAALVAGTYTQSTLSSKLAQTTEGKRNIAAFQAAHPGGKLTATPTGVSKAKDLVRSKGSCNVKDSESAILAQVISHYASLTGLKKSTTDGSATYWAHAIKTCAHTFAGLDQYLKASPRGKAFRKTTSSVDPKVAGKCLYGAPPGSKWFAVNSSLTDVPIDAGSKEFRLILAGQNGQFADGYSQYNRYVGMYFITPDGKKVERSADAAAVRYAARLYADLNGGPEVEKWALQANKCDKSVASIIEDIKKSSQAKSTNNAWTEGIKIWTDLLRSQGVTKDLDCIGKGHIDVGGFPTTAEWRRCIGFPSEREVKAAGRGEGAESNWNTCLKMGVDPNSDWGDVAEGTAGKTCEEWRAMISDVNHIDYNKWPQWYKDFMNAKNCDKIEAGGEATCGSPEGGRGAGGDGSGPNQDDGGDAPDQSTPANGGGEASASDCGDPAKSPDDSCMGDSSSFAMQVSDSGAGGSDSSGEAFNTGSRQIARIAYGPDSSQFRLVASTTVTPDCSADTLDYPTIQQGDSGHCVVIARWYASGITRTKVGKGNTFDNSLKNEIVKLQVAGKLKKQDGVVDNNTWQLLRKQAQKVQQASLRRKVRFQRLVDNSIQSRTIYSRLALADCPDLPVVKLGQTGNCVKLAQQLIGIAAKVTVPVDGKYEASTQAAVKKFQQDHSLVASGAVDKRTWEYMQLTTNKTAYHSPMQPSSGYTVDARND